MPSSLRSKTQSGPAGRSAVSTAFMGTTKPGRVRVGGIPRDDDTERRRRPARGAGPAPRGSADLRAAQLRAEGRDLGDGETDVGALRGGDVLLERGHEQAVVAKAGRERGGVLG